MSVTKETLYKITFPADLKQWDIIRNGEGQLNSQAMHEFHRQLVNFTREIEAALDGMVPSDTERLCLECKASGKDCTPENCLWPKATNGNKETTEDK